MNRLEELLQERCPEGVAFKAVAEVTRRALNVRWGDAGDEHFQYIDLTSVDRVTHEIIGTATIRSGSAPDRARQVVQTGDVIFATTRPTQMRWALITSEFDGQIASTGYCVLRPDGSQILSNFLAHSLGTARFRDHLERNQVKGNYPSISDRGVREYRMPVPPLEVQREIARILDQFTEQEAELEAQLEAELEARRHQYEFYRNQLLAAVEASAQKVPLGELAFVGTGNRNTNESVEGGKYPFFVRSQEVLAINEYEFDETAVITAGDGVGVGKVFHFAEGKYGLHQRAYRIRVTTDALRPKFLFHYIRSDFARYLATTSLHASVTSLRKPMFEKYVVPVPSLVEQDRIVSILDKLDAFAHDLSIELRAELRARRQQYEYYRDKLLTFPEAAA